MSQRSFNLQVVAMKGYSIFPKDRSLMIRWFSVISGTLVGEGFYLFAEMQSVYSVLPADWAEIRLQTYCFIFKLFKGDNDFTRYQTQQLHP